MNLIIGYKILIADDMEKLEKDVVELLNKGWEPLGAPFVVAVISPPKEKITVCQAMIRKVL